ncbi:MAG: GNAT family N-acetyltransferase [Acidimicrobiales bacterium]
MPGSAHLLCQLFAAVADGRFPEPDSIIDVVGPPPGPVDAVVAFTAHHVVAANVEPSWVQSQLPEGDLSAPMSPGFLGALGERLGSRPGSLDLVLFARGEPGELELPLVKVSSPIHHPRVDRAHRYRRRVSVYADQQDRAVLIIGTGLADRTEAAFEVHPRYRGQGLGRALARTCLRLIEPGEPLFMQTAPGNAASLRAILAAGYAPVGGEVLFRRT